MLISDAIDRFDAVYCCLAADDAATHVIVPEVQALVALYSLDMPKGQTLENLLIVAAEVGHTHLIKTGML
jgi:hypothetical protein